MNVVKKMVLLPENSADAQKIVTNVLNKQAEHEVRGQKESFGVFSELSRLLESDVRSALKIRLFNSLISNYLDKKGIDKRSIAEKNEPKSQDDTSFKDNLEKEEKEETRPKKGVSKVQPRITPVKNVDLRPKRIIKPNKKYLNEQFGSGILVPIKWTTLKKF